MLGCLLGTMSVECARDKCMSVACLQRASAWTSRKVGIRGAGKGVWDLGRGARTEGLCQCLKDLQICGYL